MKNTGTRQSKRKEKTYKTTYKTRAAKSRNYRHAIVF